jgi:hypothetical protein
MSKKPNHARKRGPQAETLTVEGNWKDAVKTALANGKPPAPEKKSSAKKKRRSK